jgi:hypothetical protein
MAYTYDPREVERQWPRLYRLAFPTTGEDEHDVRELVGSLADQVRFGDAGDAVRSALEPGIERLEGVRERMEKALSDWNPHQANKYSEDLEEALDELEREAKKVM